MAKVPKEVAKKAERKGAVFGARETKKQSDPIRPVDLLESVFHGDTGALFAALGPRGKNVAKVATKKERTFSRGVSGRLSMAEKAAKSKVK